MLAFARWSTNRLLNFVVSISNVVREAKQLTLLAGRGNWGVQRIIMRTGQAWAAKTINDFHELAASKGSGYFIGVWDFNVLSRTASLQGLIAVAKEERPRTTEIGVDESIHLAFMVGR